MNHDFDTKIKNAMKPSWEADVWLNQKIIDKIGEGNYAKRRRIKNPAAAALAICFVMLSSIGVVAAAKYFHAAHVAERIGDKKLSKAFRENMTAEINETQRIGDYTFTLLGIVSGKDLSELESMIKEECLDDRTYAALAITKSDGSGMTEKDENGYQKGYLDQFFVSPLIEGYEPWSYNIHSFHGNAACFVEDGVLYWLAECDNLESFASRTVYLCATETAGSMKAAYLFDESSGAISRNEEYEGFNALFTLPFDESKASEEAAEEYLEKIQNQETKDVHDAHAEYGLDEEWLASLPQKDRESILEAYEFAASVNRDNIDELCVPVEQSRQTVYPDPDGMIVFTDRSGGSSEKFLAEWFFIDFEDGEYGMSEHISYGYSEEGIESLRFTAYSKNADGSYTRLEYVPR